MDEIKKTIYDLELHESLIVQSGIKFSKIYTRVPGGWELRTFTTIFDTPNATSIFIPFDNEFQKQTKD